VPHVDQHDGRPGEPAAFAGGLIPLQNWYAPSLTNDKELGLGDWHVQELSDLLQAGVSHQGAVFGPMADVVHNSLQYMTDEDTRAMSTYLKSIPQKAEAPKNMPTSRRSSSATRCSTRARRSTPTTARPATPKTARASRRPIRRSRAIIRS
jgi:hypothetical protein